ncbi:helix-turn-helix domain-containing protein [Chelatococcus sp.]|uniref:helix-turn-helix domain-containing protein n=1 Tax=Chelatococcus sp. TaxID=1953771 RepID=UPI001EBA2F90|nr:helix-turn-helix domain-containing protein [Chelatococcus sp.]
MPTRLKNGRWNVTCLANGDWHHEEIKAAIRMMGSSCEELSRQAGQGLHVCAYATRKPHIRGEALIAKFLRLPPQHIWPSRFRSDGSRIPRVRPYQNVNATPDAGHRQIHEAA